MCCGSLKTWIISINNLNVDIMLTWLSSCQHECHHAGMVVIMPALWSSCRHNFNHAHMVVIMPAWLSSCRHGCHHAGLVAIMTALLSSCWHGCHHAGMVVIIPALWLSSRNVVIMPAWLSSCLNSLQFQECCLTFCKFITVLIMVVYLILSSSCSCLKTEKYNFSLFVVMFDPI